MPGLPDTAIVASARSGNYPILDSAQHLSMASLRLNRVGLLTLKAKSELRLSHALRISSGTLDAQRRSLIHFKETASGNNSGIVTTPATDSVTIYDLQVEQLHTTAIFKLYAPLKLKGRLSLDNPGTFISNGYLTLCNDSLDRSDIRYSSRSKGIPDKVVWQRYVPGKSAGFTFLASPFNYQASPKMDEPDLGQLPSALGFLPAAVATPSKKYYIMSYTESVPGGMDTGWTDAFRNGNLMHNGLGYNVYLPSKPARVRLQGHVSSEPTVSWSLSYTSNPAPSSDGWNLLGNPYPFDIYWSTVGVSTSNLDNYYYVYNPKTGNYVAADFSGFSINGGDGKIAQGQAFFVRATSTGAGLVMQRDLVATQGAKFYKTAPQALTISAVNTSGWKDEAKVMFSSDFSASVNGAHDAYKLSGSHLDVTSICEGTQLAINALPELNTSNKRIVPLQFTNIDGEAMTVSFKGLSSFDASTSIFVENTESGELVNLTSHPEYQITLPAGTSSNHYRLLFSAPLDAKQLSTDASLVNLSLYPNPLSGSRSSVTLSGLDDAQPFRAEVLDITGRVISSEAFTAQSMAQIALPQTAGVYLIRVTQQGAQRQMRVIRQ